MPIASTECDHPDIAPIRFGIAVEKLPTEPNTVNLLVAEDDAWVGLVVQNEARCGKLAKASWYDRLWTPIPKRCIMPTRRIGRRTRLTNDNKPPITSVIIAPDNALVI